MDGQVATFEVRVPVAAVEDLVTAVALRLGVERPGPEGYAALGEDFAQAALFDAYIDFVAQRAAQQARDGAAAWRGAAG